MEPPMSREPFDAANRFPGRRSWWWSRAGVWVLAATAVLGSVGAAVGVWLALRPPAPTEVPPTLPVGGLVQGPAYPRAEFERLVTGKTVDEVRAAIGEPSFGVRGGGGTTLTYYGRTIDPATGRRDTMTSLWFEDGKAVGVSYE
jgi:hypothetical protein